jgi:hypothetical protein
LEYLAQPGWHTYRVVAPAGEKDISGSFQLKPAAFLVESIKWNSADSTPASPVAYAPYLSNHQQGFRDLIPSEAAENSIPTIKRGSPTEAPGAQRIQK